MTAIFISIIFIFIFNIAAYWWAYRFQSDHLTDITYSLTFILLTLYFLVSYQTYSIERIIFGLMVILWGTRLGGFLYYRIHQMGKDDRFDAFRGDKLGFLKFWVLQALSIWILALPIMIGLQLDDLSLSWGVVLLWSLGFVIEAIADYQKMAFRQKIENKALFIDTGMYKYIRHPNYIGEIIIWTAIFLYIAPSISGLQWMAIISPLWIIVLLVGISGIPLIEQSNSLKYKDNKSYWQYVKRTKRLIPFIY